MINTKDINIRMMAAVLTDACLITVDHDSIIEILDLDYSPWRW